MTHRTLGLFGSLLVISGGVGAFVLTAPDRSLAASLSCVAIASGAWCMALAYWLTGGER
jgi:hypothetical protein